MLEVNATLQNWDRTATAFACLYVSVSVSVCACACVCVSVSVSVCMSCLVRRRRHVTDIYDPLFIEAAHGLPLPHGVTPFLFNQTVAILDWLVRAIIKHPRHH